MLSSVLFVGLQTGRNPGCLKRARPMGLSKALYSMLWEEIKTCLTPKPLLFLDSFVYCIPWAHHRNFSSVKILLSSYLNNLMGPGFSSCGSYISLYIISMLQKFDCQLHVGKNKQGITVTKLFLKLKYIFMCLWLFIAESTFYRQYIKCYLSCFHWGFLVSCVCVFAKNNYSLSGFPPPCSCVIIFLIASATDWVGRHRMLLQMEFAILEPFMLPLL